MAYRMVDGNVQITMSPKEYRQLLYLMGIAAGESDEMLRMSAGLMSSINEGNPDFSRSKMNHLLSELQGKEIN